MIHRTLFLLQPNLNGYKLPKSGGFLAESELPRSTTGKIVRHELEARLAALEGSP